MKKLLFICFAVLCLHNASAQNPPITPAWAFEHIVWEDSLNTRAGATKLIDLYFEHKIPVGGIIIDSPWTTTYNDFNWDQAKYPNHQEMISYFKQKDVKIILWMTGAVNYKCLDTPQQKSESYDEAVANKLGINDTKPTPWWKGEGIFIDFTNPKAVEWWHTQLDKVFVDGVYGWKVDNADSYFGNIVKTSKGEMSNEQFRPYYYSAMYDYTTKRNPKGIILSRPYSFQGGYYANTEKMSLGWCGDFDGDWKGLKMQVKDIYISAKRGYGAVGCEVGGFWGRRSTKQQLIRYAQFGCMNATMINGGMNGAFTNHLPWWHDEETTDIYRYCVELHHQLIPYMFSTVVDAHLRGGALLKNASFEEESHQVGDYIFTKAITSENNDVEFHLPLDGEWIDFFTGEKYSAGELVKHTYPLNQFPLFVKSGAIIPMNISNDITGIGDESMKGRRTILIYPNGVSHRVLHLPCGDGVEYEDCEVKFNEESGELLVKGASAQGYTFILKGVSAAKRVKGADSWNYDKKKQQLRIDCEGQNVAVKIKLK